jgi:hypothetical protein
MYGLATVMDSVYWYYSPLSILPLLHIVNIMRDKQDHVTVLLVTMLLQLERQGYFNLSRFPSHQPLKRDYTAPFEQHVNHYHQEMNPVKFPEKIPEPYKGYAMKLYGLWHSRPEMPCPERYVIGRTVAEEEFRTHSFQENGF